MTGRELKADLMISFLIADTFTDSLARLTGDEQKLAKTTAFDLQMNPASPGHGFHKLDRAKDQNFWSVRVSSHIRMIVHRTAASLLLCYVDHHDQAYRWAERRKIEAHPQTGAAQIVLLVETVREVEIPHYVTVDVPIQDQALAKSEKSLLFASIPDDQLLSYGVPPDWLATVRTLNEDSLLVRSADLPAEAAEALLELAIGGTPLCQPTPAYGVNPFNHPDALRRFRTLNDVGELAAALDYPWDRWAIFLHPSQRELVDQDFPAPARVSGSAGTGKTVVALHRAVSLASRYPGASILLTTFSPDLAALLRSKIKRLLLSEPKVYERLEVADLCDIGRRFYKPANGELILADRDYIQKAILAASGEALSSRFSQRFLMSEWSDVVDAWQIRTWEEYRDVRRLGRKTRLSELQRKLLWGIFERVIADIDVSNRITYAGLFTRLAAQVTMRKHPLFDFIVVDEAQDLSVSQLRFMAAAGGSRPNALFFAGDLGQRIFQPPFSWKSLGVDIRGRSRTLNINYRTSHQIRSHADRLLAPSIADVDGNVEGRKGTVSVFNGLPPNIFVAGTEEEEQSFVAGWLESLVNDGVQAGEIGIFVRSEAQLHRAEEAAQLCNLQYQSSGQPISAVSSTALICTMHRAKGLEFKAVAIMACDDGIIPLQERIEEIGDDTDIEEVYNTERHLLYVAATRARDFLLVTGVDPPSEFLDDLLGK
jgi:hypothetical protein